VDSRWILPLALLVVIVIPAAIAAGPALIGVLTEDRRPFSLCPDDRHSDQIVGGSQMAAKGAAYKGPGPHQLIVDGPTYADEVMPESWSPPRASNHAWQIEELQLVACEYRYDVGVEEDLNTCVFRSIDGSESSYRLTQQSAKYDYRVYEVTTGKEVASFTLEAVATECAQFRQIPTGANSSEFPGEPDFAQLKRKLQPLIMADLPS
jgi:hypothetical protein